VRIQNGDISARGGRGLMRVGFESYDELLTFCSYSWCLKNQLLYFDAPKLRLVTPEGELTALSVVLT
jgi:hypothetical protein